MNILNTNDIEYGYIFLPDYGVMLSPYGPDHVKKTDTQGRTIYYDLDGRETRIRVETRNGIKYSIWIDK